MKLIPLTNKNKFFSGFPFFRRSVADSLSTAKNPDLKTGQKKKKTVPFGMLKSPQQTSYLKKRFGGKRGCSKSLLLVEINNKILKKEACLSYGELPIIDFEFCNYGIIYPHLTKEALSVAKIVKEIQMGDYTITLKDHGEGRFVTRLSSGRYGGLLELEKTDYGLKIHQIEIGSAEVTVEHLALMLILIQADGDLAAEIEKINNIRNHKVK